MGRIGKVLGWVTAAVAGVVKNDTGGGALFESELYSGGAGTDAPPLATDFVLTIETQGTGHTAVAGVADGSNASIAAAGERRTYARDAGGVIKVTLHMKADGSAKLFNDSGAIELKPDGSVDINGAVISAIGEITSASGIGMDTHIHPQGADSAGHSEQDTGVAQ